MGNQVEHKQLNSDLLLPWIVVGTMLLMLVATIMVCHVLGEQIQQVMPENQRATLRTLLYAVAIVTFPLTNLIRHIQLRLNQTMPCPDTHYQQHAKSRYLLTIIVSMSLVEVVGMFGLVMFIVGDSFNTLYILTGLSVLGLFLYRPKTDEYANIIATLASRHE
jgi:hypothetical protein